MCLLHDTGKIDQRYHPYVWCLTPDEWKIMRSILISGAHRRRTLSAGDASLFDITMNAGMGGIPVGLQKRISQPGRFAVVDVFDALTSTRSYREKSSADEALQYLQEQANLLFDPEIVEALTRLPYKEFIEGEKTTV
jgi:hypothetical protein